MIILINAELLTTSGKGISPSTAQEFLKHELVSGWTDLRTTLLSAAMTYLPGGKFYYLHVGRNNFFFRSAFRSPCEPLTDMRGH